MKQTTGYTKAKIYNLALSLLLLSRRVIDPETENSNEAKILNDVWPTALDSTLADMNLTSTSLRAQTPLVAKLFDGNENGPRGHHWKFAYQYPPDCGFFRRIISHMEVDDKSSHIPKLIGLYKGGSGNVLKVIFTNHHWHHSESLQPIWIEYIPKDFPIPMLTGSAAMCLASQLAMLGAPLITGKGAKTLIDSIEKKYIYWKALAQQQDSQESFSFQTEATMSEFVRVRESGFGEGLDWD